MPLLQSAQELLDGCSLFRDFFSALATLDALAGFAEATHPSAAPPGCHFCRPTFAARGAGGAGEAPCLALQGLWNPALLASSRVDAIQANDVQLGSGRQPCMLLLTGANAGGKSTLL